MRDQGEQNIFFHVFNILSFDLSLERGLQTDSQGILAYKDTAGQSGFPEAARVYLQARKHIPDVCSSSRYTRM